MARRGSQPDRRRAPGRHSARRAARIFRSRAPARWRSSCRSSPRTSRGTRSAGRLLLRPIRQDDGDAGPEGIEILAIDAGPGHAGRGAGAARRISPRPARSGTASARSSGSPISSSSTPSRPARSSLARLWRDRPGRRPCGSRGTSSAPCMCRRPGEDVCGDDWDWRMRDDRLAIIVADGLGHGLAAHDAARAAIRAFHRSYEESPQRVIQDVHDALRADPRRRGRGAGDRPGARCRRDTAASATSAPS